jgi:putative membrane protein
MLSVVLAGHPKLKNDLRRSSMEEIGSRATIFELEGLGSEKRKYLKWLLAQSVAPKTKIESVITDVAISAVASLFLCWLVYYHAPADVTGTHLLFLPALNALSAIALVTGFCFIRARRVSEHRAAMFTAFVFSSLFLVTYITNHALHGDMRFQGPGPIRYVYFPLLISHIGLSVVALPMILITFFLSLSGRFPAHRRLARFTFPIWLYVSVSGVIVYAMLAAYR